MAKPRENTFGIEFEEILCFYRYSWPHYQIFLIDLGFWNFSQKNSVSKPPHLRRMADTKNLILILLNSFNKIQFLRGRNLSLRKYWASLY